LRRTEAAAGRRLMERRFRVRLNELLDDARVRPSVLQGVLPRLDAFLQPFVTALHTPERQTNARHYVQGLLSDLGGKDVESIAYLHDRERQGLQKFIGQADWDHRPLLAELARQVGRELGETDGVLVFDPSAFPKKGTESVGVQRQWCGRLGKIDNCQVAVYLGYASRREHALVDVRLYLPQEWAKRRRRRRKAGVPDAVRFRTRHELALELLDERGPALPHAWVSGEHGRPGVGRGGAAGGLPRTARRWLVETRLPAVERGGRDDPGRVRPRLQGAAPDRGMSEAGQGRGRAGGLPGADVGGLAPSSGPIPPGHLVLDTGDPAGKKSGRRR